jgi:sodium transport system permease protein
MVLSLAVSVVPMFKLFNDEGESPWDLWVPSLAQSTLMGRVLKGTAIGVMDVVPGVVVCLVVTVVALTFVSRQLTKRAAQ